MTLHKLKICFGCKKSKYIWKRDLGKGYCKQCWNIHRQKKSDVKFNKKMKVFANQKIFVPKKRIYPKSQKRIIADKKYSKLRLKLLDEHPHCQAQIPGVCSGLSTQCHHKAGRIGSLYTDYSKFLAVCHNCHNWIEIHVIEAKELGFSLNRL